MTRPIQQRDIPPIHPGEILRLDFLEPMGINPARLARSIAVPRNRVTAILKGERAITADTSIRLGHYFGMSLDYWLNLQSHFDFEQAQAASGSRISQSVVPYQVENSAQSARP